MNIEELELSLRTEFEGQVRNVLAGIRQDVAEFQTKFQSELEEHRNRLDLAINELSSRVPESGAFDAAFNESVGEHLRLARDDGAQVAAIAFGEAEKLRGETAAPVAGFDRMRDAIAEISSKNSQATILQALVEQASQFAARGAFFIVKNDHFVGWRTFGSESPADAGVREVLFAASADTVLASSVASMAPVTAIDGGHADDKFFLDPLGFGRPATMHAIPLIARGRGVAVLYADAGVNGGGLNLEALETLVRVAALTVELLAASQTVAPAAPAAVESTPADEHVENAATSSVEAPPEPAETYEYVPEEASAAPGESTRSEVEFDAPVQTEEPVAEMVEEYSVPAVEDHATTSEPAYEVSQPPYEPVQEFEVQAEEYTGEVTYEVENSNFESSYEVPTVSAPENNTVESVETTIEQPKPVADFAFSSGGSYDASYEVHTEQAEQVESPMPIVDAPVATSLNGNGHVATIEATVTEPVVEVAASQPKKSRFSDRNVDLPIEVADDERKLHNDARRFARLLVSEIKLYNEQKVSEGREAGNLYEQLKEAIDRSREMYDKRVQPAVASKFDYFHYEVVNSLADGQDAKLGSGYPGASV